MRMINMSDLLKKLERQANSSKEFVDVERSQVCFEKMNWMQNEATQDLRDFIRSLIDSITTPFIRKVVMMEKRYDAVIAN